MANYDASDITTDEQAALDQVKEETEAAVKYDIAAKNAKDPATKEAMEHNKNDELEHAGLMGAIAAREEPEDKEKMMDGVKELDSIMKKSISECIRERQGRLSSPGSFESAEGFEKSSAPKINPEASSKDIISDIYRLDRGQTTRAPVLREEGKDAGLSPEMYRRISYNPMSMLTRLALGLGEYEKEAAQNDVKDDVFENEKYVNTDEDERADVSEEKTGRERRVEDTALEEEAETEDKKKERPAQKAPLSVSPGLGRLLDLIAKEYSSQDIPAVVRGDRESTKAARDWRTALGNDLKDIVRGIDIPEISDRALSKQKWAQQYLDPYEMGDTSTKDEEMYDWGTPAFSTYSMDPASLGTRFNDAVKMIYTIDGLKAAAERSPRRSEQFIDALDQLKTSWQQYLRKISGAIGWDMAFRNEKTDDYDTRAHIFDDQTLEDFEKQFGADRAAELRAGKIKGADLTDDEKNFILPRTYGTIDNNDFWRNHAGGFNLDDMMDYYNFVAQSQGQDAGDPLKDLLAGTAYKGDEGVEELFRGLIDVEDRAARSAAIQDYVAKNIGGDPIAQLRAKTSLTNALNDVMKGLKEIPEDDEKYLTRGPLAQYRYNKDVMNERNKKTAADILEYAERNEIELPEVIKANLEGTRKTGNTKDPKDKEAPSIFNERAVKDIIDQMNSKDNSRVKYADTDLDRLKAKMDAEARKAVDNAESREDVRQYGIDDEFRAPSLEDVEKKYSDFYYNALQDADLASKIADFLPKDDTAKDARKQIGAVGKGWYSDLPVFMNSKAGKRAIIDAFRDMAQKGEVKLPADFDETLPLDQGVNREIISKLMDEGSFFNMRGQGKSKLMEFLDNEDDKADDLKVEPTLDAEDLLSGRTTPERLAKLKDMDAGAVTELLDTVKTYDDLIETGKFGDIDVSDNAELLDQLRAEREENFNRLKELTDPETEGTIDDIISKINLEDNMDRSKSRYKLGIWDSKISGAEDFNARKAAIAKDLMGGVPLALLSRKVPQAYSPDFIEKYGDQNWFDPKSGTTTVFDRMMKVYGGRDEYGMPVWNFPKKEDLGQIEDNVKKFLLGLTGVGRLMYHDPAGKGTDVQAQFEDVADKRRTENAAFLDSVYPVMNDAFFNGLDIDNYSGERPEDADKFFEMFSGKRPEAPEEVKISEETVESKEIPASEPEKKEVKEMGEETAEPEKIVIPVKKSATENKCTRVRRRSDADDLPDDTGSLTEKDLKEPTIRDDAEGSKVKHLGDPEIKKSISDLIKERFNKRR